jgi:flagellar biosynthesis protein FlhG
MSDPVSLTKPNYTRPALRGPEQPAVLVVSGGRFGVGATSAAIGIAQALAHDAQRIVLIDADRQTANLAARCGVAKQAGIDEVLSGRKSIHEAMQRGPAGLQLLPGARSPEGLTLSDRAIDRLLRQMRTLAPHTDAIVVDAGSQATELASRFWQSADRLVIVTSPDAASVMDSYALIKRLFRSASSNNSLSIVVSQAGSRDQAADVFRRIDQSCQRFLGISVAFSGLIPLVPGINSGHNESELSAAYSALARQLVSSPRTAVVPPLAA